MGPAIYGLEVALPGPVGDRRIVSLDQPPQSMGYYEWEKAHYPDATPRAEYPASP